MDFLPLGACFKNLDFATLDHEKMKAGFVFAKEKFAWLEIHHVDVLV
jgi:hypothetical protein